MDVDETDMDGVPTMCVREGGGEDIVAGRTVHGVEIDV